jgi:hypothetical protein
MFMGNCPGKQELSLGLSDSTQPVMFMRVTKLLDAGVRSLLCCYTCSTHESTAKMRFLWHNRQSKRLSLLRSWLRFPLRTHHTYVKRVCQCSTKSRGFSPGTPVSTGNVDRVGWDYPPNWPFYRSCAPWSDLSPKVIARGALRKPSTSSCWAASIASHDNTRFSMFYCLFIWIFTINVQYYTTQYAAQYIQSLTPTKLSTCWR